jgi:phosphate starvation-inducible protein PhoH
MPRRKKPDIEDSEEIENIISSFKKTKIKLKKIEFSDKQKELLKIMFDKDTKIIFLSGPAGTSKTFMAIYGALQLFNQDNEYNISYVRTIIESADRGMGALPGSVDEKFCPFMMPLEDKLFELLQASDARAMINKKVVSAMPINYLRGASINNQIVVADECQNFSEKELITLITRIGENSKMFICGDPMQSDINGRSGFSKIKGVFNDDASKKQGIHNFTFDFKDIKRSVILKYIIKKIELNERSNKST